MKRFIAALCLIAFTVAVAAPNIFTDADKFTKKYKTSPTLPPASTYAYALVSSPAANGVIQVLDTTTHTIRDLRGSDMPNEPFSVTVTLTSAAAATPVVIIPDSQVPASRKVYVTGFHSKVNGATAWTTTTSVKLQDSAGSPIDFFTIAVAALTGNAEIRPGTANVTSENAYILGTGGTLAKGLQVKGNANAGAGSDLTLTVSGYIK